MDINDRKADFLSTRYNDIHRQYLAFIANGFTTLRLGGYDLKTNVETSSINGNCLVPPKQYFHTQLQERLLHLLIFERMECEKKRPLITDAIEDYLTTLEYGNEQLTFFQATESTAVAT